jgi:hypothetical protein
VSAERVGDILRREFPKIFQQISCPRCGQAGGLGLFDEPANGGLGICCTACGRHPILGVMWLKQGDNRKPDNVVRVAAAQGGTWCMCCGITEAEAAELRLGFHVHHTLPFADVGDDAPTLLLCALCHEIATALQRRVMLQRRLMEAKGA